MSQVACLAFAVLCALFRAQCGSNFVEKKIFDGRVALIL
jgi:hypothetical protein